MYVFNTMSAHRKGFSFAQRLPSTLVYTFPYRPTSWLPVKHLLMVSFQMWTSAWIYVKCLLAKVYTDLYQTYLSRSSPTILPFPDERIRTKRDALHPFFYYLCRSCKFQLKT